MMYAPTCRSTSATTSRTCSWSRSSSPSCRTSRSTRSSVRFFPLGDQVVESSRLTVNMHPVWNSGAEAVEASIKLARHATGKQNIIAVQGSYHGRTFGTMALTKSKTIYGAGYAPLMVRPSESLGRRGSRIEAGVLTFFWASRQCAPAAGCVYDSVPVLAPDGYDAHDFERRARRECPVPRTSRFLARLCAGSISIVLDAHSADRGRATLADMLSESSH